MRDGTSDPPQTLHRCSGVGFIVVPTPSVTRIWTFEPGRKEQGLCLTKHGKFGQMGNSCRHKCGQIDEWLSGSNAAPLDGRVRRAVRGQLHSKHPNGLEPGRQPESAKFLVNSAEPGWRHWPTH